MSDETISPLPAEPNINATVEIDKSELKRQILEEIGEEDGGEYAYLAKILSCFPELARLFIMTQRGLRIKDQEYFDQYDNSSYDWRTKATIWKPEADHKVAAKQFRTKFNTGGVPSWGEIYSIRITPAGGKYAGETMSGFHPDGFFDALGVMNPNIYEGLLRYAQEIWVASSSIEHYVDRKEELEAYVARLAQGTSDDSVETAEINDLSADRVRYGSRTPLCVVTLRDSHFPIETAQSLIEMIDDLQKLTALDSEYIAILNQNDTLDELDKNLRSCLVRVSDPEIATQAERLLRTITTKSRASTEENRKMRDALSASLVQRINEEIQRRSPFLGEDNTSANE